MIRLLLTLVIALLAAFTVHNVFAHVGTSFAKAIYVPVQDAQVVNPR